MTIAAVITARNERVLLASNIDYHKNIGVSKFFIFLDRLDIKEWIELKKYSEVTVFISSPSLIKKYNINGKSLSYRYLASHMIRQMVHIKIAQRLAYDEGYAWLMNIDADELICTDVENPTRSNLGDILSHLPEAYQAVHFSTMEVMPDKRVAGTPFGVLNNFKRSSPFGEGRRFTYGNQLVQSNLQRHLARHLENQDYDPFWIIADEVKHRDLGPLTAVIDEFGTVNVIDWFIGHGMGKEMIRLSPDIRYRNLHEANVKMQNRYFLKDGALLHFNNFSMRDTYKKYVYNFKNHPNQYASGWAIDPLKRHFRDTINKNGSAAVASLFWRYCFFSERKLRAIKQKFPEAIVNIDISPLVTKSIVLAT